MVTSNTYYNGGCCFDCNAQSGMLTTMYDGARPSGRYNPMKKQGAIILGIGVDNSNGAQGNFFEGVMTSGNASDASDKRRAGRRGRRGVRH